MSTNVFWQSGIKTLTIPPKLDILCGNFFACEHLTTINVSKTHRGFFWEEGILWNSDKSVIFFAVRTLEGVIEVPDSVVEIQQNAFADCAKVTGVHFGDGSKLKRIEGWAFFDSGLRLIRIPNGVTVIGEGAFSHCGQLKHIDFQEGSELTDIGSEAFRASGLEEFNGPPKLNRLGRGSFAYTDTLRMSVLPPGIVLIQQDAFGECDNLEVVRSTLPKGRITVQCRGFSSRFNHENFRHNPEVDSN
jgi:hypothetical protein